MFWNCIKRSYKLIIQQLFLKEKSIDFCQHSESIRKIDFFPFKKKIIESLISMSNVTKKEINMDELYF